MSVFQLLFGNFQGSLRSQGANNGAFIGNSFRYRNLIGYLRRIWVPCRIHDFSLPLHSRKVVSDFSDFWGKCCYRESFIRSLKGLSGLFSQSPGYFARRDRNWRDKPTQHGTFQRTKQPQARHTLNQNTPPAPQSRHSAKYQRIIILQKFINVPCSIEEIFHPQSANNSL